MAKNKETEEQKRNRRAKLFSNVKAPYASESNPDSDKLDVSKLDKNVLKCGSNICQTTNTRWVLIGSKGIGLLPHRSVLFLSS